MRMELEDKPEIEYLDGRAHRKVSPKSRHSLVQAAFARLISRAGHASGLIGPEWRFRICGSGLRKTVLVPDVAYLSLERLRGVPSGERDEPTVAPEIAVEVLSPGDDQRFLAQKIERYLQRGALLVLVADPLARTLTAHAADGVTAYAAGDCFRHAAVPWLRFDVREAFGDLDRFESP